MYSTPLIACYSFYRPDEVGELYLKFGPYYNYTLNRLVEAALKNRLINVSLDEMRLDRANVEIAMHQAAQRKLGGK